MTWTQLTVPIWGSYATMFERLLRDAGFQLNHYFSLMDVSGVVEASLTAAIFRRVAKSTDDVFGRLPLRETR